jgi:hypothetical protein
MSQTKLLIIILIAGLVCLIGINSIENYYLNERVNKIEKVLSGPKFLCSARQKIKGTWINCDQLKRSE